MSVPTFLGPISDDTVNVKGFITSTAGVTLIAERSEAGGVRARYDDRAAWWYITSQRVAATFRPRCPRCGRDRMGRAGSASLSRKDNETEICNPCAYDEAMLFGGVPRNPTDDVWPGYPNLLG